MAQRREDRRRHLRFQCGGKAEIRGLSSGVRSVAKIANLSLEGCWVRIGDGQCFRRGETVEMTFCVRQLPVRVQGFVRQSPPDQTVGVEFTLLTARGRRLLLQLIEELAAILREQAESPANVSIRSTEVP